VRYDPAKHHRRSIRLKEYDYTQAGAYFVTVCTQGQACLFGEVVDGEMRVNYAGRMVIAEWEMLPKRFPNVVLDAFVVMPNHVHGILVITDVIPVGAGSPCPYRITAQTPAGVETALGAETAPLRGPTLGNVVAYFKYQTTKAINAVRQTPSVRLWQRNYYEHIIRNETSLHRIREYIANNPLQWALDRENPDNVGAGLPRPYGDEPWRI
jgi:putative transposase